MILRSLVKRASQILTFGLVAFVISITYLSYKQETGTLSRVIPISINGPWSDSPAETALAPTVYQYWDQAFGNDPLPFAMPELTRKCSQVDFHEDIYLECGGIVAGLTTIISQAKTCVRMAVDLGYNLIMPKLVMRDSTDLTDFNFFNASAQLPLGDWFEEAHFTSALQRACPNMKIAPLKPDKSPDLAITRQMSFHLDWLPSWSGSRYAWTGSDWHILFHKKVLSEMIVYKRNEVIFEAEMAAKNLTAEVSTTAPGEPEVNVVLSAAQFNFYAVTDDVSGHDVKIWTELHHLFRGREDVRRAVAIIMDVMKDTPTYYGIHHRAEDDWPEEWMGAEQQTVETLKILDDVRAQYNHTGPRIAYVACGDADAIDTLRERAAAVNWTITDKYQIASSHPDLQTALSLLEFDHQGLIDLAVLVLSSFYIGITTSAFSWTIAHTRDPLGRYRGPSLPRMKHDKDSQLAATHLFFLGQNSYSCCL